MDIFGWVVVLLALGGIAAVLIGYARKHPDQVAGLKAWMAGLQPRPDPISSSAAPQAFATDTISSSERGAQLKVVQASQMITLVGDKPRTVRAAITLYEMIKKTERSNWSRSGVESRVLELSGGVWIFKVPVRDGGEAMWLKVTELKAPKLEVFYKGTDQNPGPAKRLRANQQTEPVPYALPGRLMPVVTWEAIDIGTFDVVFDGNTGKSDKFVSGDRLYFVTSQEQGGGRWMIYLDARKSEAQGATGLYVGEPIEPSAEVQDLL